jgi:hypothetical protein
VHGAVADAAAQPRWQACWRAVHPEGRAWPERLPALDDSVLWTDLIQPRDLAAWITLLELWDYLPPLVGATRRDGHPHCRPHRGRRRSRRMNTTDRSLYGIDLAVTLAAPYLVHGNDPGRFGLHATLLTDPQGRPVLPGSLLAGRIAEAWTAHGAELGGADADRWFGRPGFGAQDGAQRARLLSADLRLTTVEGQPFDPAAPCHDLDAARVRIDADTGSVAAGALLQVEQVAAPGAALRFAGRWTTWALPTEIDALCLQIRAALLLQTQLGAWRNVGFGRLLEVEVSAQRLPVATQRAAAPQPAVAAAAASSRRFALLSSEPLCVSTRSRRGNVFESGEVIPGAALLGALATQLCQRHGVATLADLAGRSTLARHFDTLRCSQALPAPFTGGRPLPLPQSLVSVKISPDHREIRDAWRHAEPPPTPPGPPRRHRLPDRLEGRGLHPGPRQTGLG